MVPAALLNLPKGMPEGSRADVADDARRDREPGDTLDGEGGYTVLGRLMSADDAVGLGAVPISLNNGAAIKKPNKEG